jgi:hypothetical protein
MHQFVDDIPENDTSSEGKKDSARSKSDREFVSRKMPKK